MRELIVYSCYVLGGIGCVVAAAVLFDENLFSSLTLFFGSIGVFAIGFICDKLAGIEQALLASDGADYAGVKPNIANDSYLDGMEPESDASPKMRLENGMIVIETEGGEMTFPDMQAAHNYLKGS